MSMKKLFSMRNVMLAGAIACVAAFTVTPANADAAKKAVRATALSTDINYEREIVTFEGGDSSKKKVFFAFAKKEGTADKIKNWDDVKKSSGKIDISTLIGTKKTYVVYKDGADGEPKELAIAAAPKVSLDKKGANVNEGSFHLIDKSKDTKVVSGPSMLEIKKGKRGDWEEWGANEKDGKPVTAGGLSEDHVNKLNRWQKSGATIYVRAKATKEYPASNEVSAKIKKLANGPKLTLDPIKVVAKMKKGTQYRVNYAGDSDNDGWSPVIDQTVARAGVSLEDLAKAGNTTTSSSLTIEYRTAKTDKKAASKITTVAINGQALAPTIGGEKSGVTIEVYKKNTAKTGKTPVTATALVAKDAGYEYKIGKSDLTKGWKAIKTGTGTIVKAAQAKDGDIILIRKKGVKAKKTTPMEWASGWAEYVVDLK